MSIKLPRLLHLKVACKDLTPIPSSPKRKRKQKDTTTTTYFQLSQAYFYCVCLFVLIYAWKGQLWRK